jgi:hypothetical protein
MGHSGTAGIPDGFSLAGWVQIVNLGQHLATALVPRFQTRRKRRG